MERSFAYRDDLRILGNNTVFWVTTPQVTLQQPAPAKVSEAAEAINDEMLVDIALDKFGGGGGAGGDAASRVSTASPKAVKTGVTGVAKGPMNHLVRLNLPLLRVAGSREGFV